MIKIILLTLIVFFATFFLAFVFLARFFTKRASSAFNAFRGRENAQAQGNQPDDNDEQKKVFSKEEGEYVDYEDVK